MHALKLTQIGNSVGVILPKEVLARLTLDIKTLRADNVKLYETLQYVRNYNAEKGNRKGRVRHGGAARGE